MTNESKTLFIPLYGKAIMSKEGFIKDITAERIIEAEAENLKKRTHHESLQYTWL